MRNTILKAVLNICIVAMFFACKRTNDGSTNGGGNGNNPTPITYGKVTGTIVAANNRTSISTATVFTQVSGTLYATKTDVNGDFTLETPTGNQHITIQTAMVLCLEPR